MQVRPWFLGLAAIVAAAAFCLALLVAIVNPPFHQGLAPPVPQHAAQR